MFTGIIEEIGTISTISARGKYRKIRVSCSKVLEGTVLGDSIAIDGACQTVVDFGDGYFTVEALAETIKKTTLGGLSHGSKVNLERSATLQTRLGGHLVQGHVNGVGTIRKITKQGENRYVTINVPKAIERFCVSEGSITINGISLTTSDVAPGSVTISVIPHTWEYTTLSLKKNGDKVNLEADIIGRYVVNMFDKLIAHEKKIREVSNG